MFWNLLKTMRPKQWVKNGFLFAALVFDRQLNNLPAILNTVAGVIAFSMIASAIYILNDLADIESDRQHPVKRSRPLASGKLSPRVAWGGLVLLLAAGLGIAASLDVRFLGICILYLVTNLAYSFRLKHIPLVDILLLASFYVMRVGAGVTLIEVERFSPWLYVFTTFLALFLGIGKRRAELKKMSNEAGNTRKVLEGYTLPFLDQLNIIVSSMAIITYSLYTFSAPNLPDNHTMMLTIPFVIFGIFRYLYLVQVENVGEAPDDVLFSDRQVQLSIGLFILAILIIFYFA